MLHSVHSVQVKGTEKHKWVRAVKSKPKAFRPFKVDLVLKIDATFFSRLSLCVVVNLLLHVYES